MATSSNSANVQKPHRWELLMYELTRDHYDKKTFSTEEMLAKDVQDVIKKAVPEISNMTSMQIVQGNLVGRRLWIKWNKRRGSQQEPMSEEFLRSAEGSEEERRTSESSDETVKGDSQHAFINGDDEVTTFAVIHKK